MTELKIQQNSPAVPLRLVVSPTVKQKKMQKKLLRQRLLGAGLLIGSLVVSILDRDITSLLFLSVCYVPMMGKKYIMAF